MRTPLPLEDVVTEEALATWAARFSATLQPGDVVCLYGDLGAGKTSYVRACLTAMTGQNIDVPSPTFTLCQIYDAPKGEVHHYDLYRIKSVEEIIELGLIEHMSSVITFIEWPQLIEAHLPTSTYRITLTHHTPLTRLLSIQGK